MALGLLLENIREGALALHYDVRFEMGSAVLGKGEPAALAFLTRMPNSDDYNISHVIRRSTNRLPYEKRALANTVKEQLQSICSDGNTRLVIAEGALQTRLANLLSQLEYARFTNSKLLREALEFIRWNREEIEKERDLLDCAHLNLGPTLGRVVRVLGTGSLFHQLFRLSGAAGSMRDQQRKILQESGCLMVFILKERSYKNFIQYGQVLGRVMNYLAKENIQTMSCLGGLYLTDVMYENPEILSNAEKNILLRAKAELEAVFEVLDKHIVYVVRAGYGPPLTDPSLRRPVEQLMLD